MPFAEFAQKRDGVMRTALLLALLSVGAASLAGAAVPLRIEGAVTMLPPGSSTVVVCATKPPYSCRKLNLYGGTKVVLGVTNRPAKLAVGEYVSVDVKGSPGSVFAIRAEVAPDRYVRALPEFKPAQAAHLQNAIRRIPGVRSVQLIPTLSEAVITFDPARTSPSLIDHRASHSGVHLALPQ